MSLSSAPELPSLPLLCRPPPSPLFLSSCTAVAIYKNCNRPRSRHISTSAKIRGFKALPTRCNAQLAELAPAASAAYGTLLLGGGLFAYAKSGSKGSLFGGLAGGALMGAAFILMGVPETKDIGDALGFGSAFIFSSIFGIRLAATRKLVPAGPLLGLSVCALFVFISAYMQDRV